jgi:hypothetical protein
MRNLNSGVRLQLNLRVSEVLKGLDFRAVPQIMQPSMHIKRHLRALVPGYTNYETAIVVPSVAQDHRGPRPQGNAWNQALNRGR